MSIKNKISSLIPRRIVLHLKYLYHSVYRIKTRKKKIISKCNYQYISKPKAHVFFGYYDVSPFNLVSDEIIYLQLNSDEKHVQVLLNHLDNLNSESVIAESNAWNWQQGVRLRWMPGDSRKIVFNDYDGKHYYARIVDIDSRIEKRIDFPLYDISKDGAYGLSLDFERLGVKRPGYGYTCRPYIESKHVLEEESIDLVNLRTNLKRPIITYAEITRIKGCESRDLRNNYINHLCFSPSGKQFLFFWLTIEGKAHKANLLVNNLETKQIKLLEGEEKVSHYVWEDDSHIICTAIDSNKKEHYYRYTVSTGKRELLSPSILNRDGHPSVLSTETLLTDTYPDLTGYQHLYIAGYHSERCMPILSIYSNCKIGGEKRTDLHPRYNPRLKMICIDANPNNYREIYLIKADFNEK